MKTIKLKNGIEFNLSAEQIEELKVQLNTEEKKGLWKPEIGEIYYSIDNYGEENDYIWSTGKTENFDYSIGNVFKTEKEAEEAIKTGWVAKLQAEQRIRQYIAEKGYDIDVDWVNYTQGKYGVFLDVKRVKGTCTYAKYNNLPYFKKSEDRDDVMKHFEADYKILFGVK